MKRPRRPRDEVAIARSLRALRDEAAALPPERRALLTDALTRAERREENEPMATKKAATKAKAAAEPAPTAIRFPQTLIDAIDEAAARISKERLGEAVTRSDAIRILVREALAARKIGVR